jgi:hypothetical protein
VYIGLLGGLLPLVILSLVCRRQASLTLPLCGPCRKRWLVADISYGLFAVIGLFALPGLCAVVGQVLDPGSGVAIGILLGFLAWVVGMVIFNYAIVVRAQITSKYIENDFVTLRLPNPSAVRAALKDRADA